MDQKTFMKLYALPLDIEKRAKRIAQLERLQAAGPQTVADVVKSSAGEGNTTVLCNATVRGTDADFEKRERLLAQLRAAQERSRRDYAEGVRLIETCADASIRVTLQVVCLEGGSYEDAACEYRRRGVAVEAEALRKKAWRWVYANIPKTVRQMS